MKALEEDNAELRRELLFLKCRVAILERKLKEEKYSVSILAKHAFRDPESVQNSIRATPSIRSTSSIRSTPSIKMNESIRSLPSVRVTPSVQTTPSIKSMPSRYKSILDDYDSLLGD